MLRVAVLVPEVKFTYLLPPKAVLYTDGEPEFWDQAAWVPIPAPLLEIGGTLPDLSVPHPCGHVGIISTHTS